nr:hypothetical protein [Tanacetum cinerariifolium]
KGKGTASEDDNQSSSGGRRQSINNERCLGERTMKSAAIKNAVAALTEVHEIIRFKAQICCGKRSRDNYFEDVWPEISAETLKARRLLQETQELLNLQRYPV